MKHIFIVLAFLTISCNEKAEDAHAHNADGSHVGEEVPRMGYTLWTDKTELFVEFPALIVGDLSRFAAHFTVL
ncbi:MAG: efflux RND transporter periplasmic adaptor subunit, partial [Pricia sp.]